MARLLVFLLVLASLPPSNAQEICVRARKLHSKVTELHVQPRPLDDAYSRELFSKFFATLDPESRFFTAADTASLRAFRTQLDNQGEEVCTFVKQATILYRTRAKAYMTFVDSVLDKPFDLSIKESAANVFLRRPQVAGTRKELNARLLKDLKFDVLASMYRQAGLDTNNYKNIETFLKFEAPARQRIRKNVVAEINALISDEQKSKTFVEESYLKAIPQSFDPHSEYFSPDEAKAFTEALNPEALSFGINLEQSTLGGVTVASLVPGGPAWDSNLINKGDLLVGLRWNKSGEYVELLDLDAQYVSDLLNRADEVAAILTIRKSAGEMRDVKLVKQKLENESNIVTGYILKSKSAPRSVGYISLPGFFTDNDAENRGCAVAVTKEIMKLKAEKVGGLILDLRFNGGGSLYEAIELIGIFIDNGAIGIVESKGQQPVTMKDVNRGLVYDGPLVIMVNGASASASEIVAGTLQDYRRAIIAGSRTFGKATGQVVVPVDNADITKGFMKVTDMRIFRVTGQTHQLTGITPDFPLDDIYSVLVTREEHDRLALTPRTVTKKTYFNPWPGYPDDIIKQAIERHTSSGKFKQIPELQRLFSSDMPLEASEFITAMRKLDASYRQFVSAPASGNALYEVANSIYDAAVLKSDPYRSEMSKAVMDQIRSSNYIQETFQLLDNIISAKP